MRDIYSGIPKIAERIARRVFRPGIGKYASGDLEEEFKLIAEESGRSKARFWYWKQVVFSHIPYFRDIISTGLMLYKNYLKLACRNILKHKGYSLINIFGLTFGITFCLLLSVGAFYWFSFDMFHENVDRLYRIREVQYYTGHTQTNFYTASALGPTLKENYPEVVDMTRIAYQGDILLRYEDSKFFESGGIAADRTFFSVMTFPFIAGNINTALDDPGSIVLSRSLSEKLFGDTDPIGKTISVDTKYDMKVKGVFEDVSLNSTYQFNFVLSWKNIRNKNRLKDDNWQSHSYPTILLLEENTNVDELSRNIKNIFKDHTGENSLKVEISLQSFPDMCLKTEHNGMTGMESLLIFGSIAFLILLISCINFMNLTTARSSFRFKEIGIRKVVGGRRKNIIIQFLSESMVLSFISLFIAVIILVPALMVLNDYSGAELTLNFIRNWWILIIMLGITAFTGLLSGSYPALYLSSFSPMATIKGGSYSGKNPVLRRILITAQLCLAIIFLISGIVGTRQFEYLMDHNMGWDRENLMYFRMRGDSNRSIGILKEELLKIPGIEKVAAECYLPYGFNSSTTGITWEGKVSEERIQVRYNYVDYNYVGLLNLEIIAGRDFSKEIAGDINNYVINETLAAIIGKEDIIGKEVDLWGNTGKIIGVLKDFNVRSLKKEMDPVLLMIRDYNYLNYTLIKLEQGFSTDVVDEIAAAWNRVLPQYPFSCNFVDDDLYALYNDEDALGIMMKGLTVFTMILTGLGLMALVSFMTHRRMKEIGIRKVLGSTVSGIIKIISKEFMVIIAVSNLFAWVLGYLLMKEFLKNYVYRTEIGYSVFIVSGLIITSVAMITIIYQTFKAARANPVDILKCD